MTARAWRRARAEKDETIKGSRKPVRATARHTARATARGSDAPARRALPDGPRPRPGYLISMFRPQRPRAHSRASYSVGMRSPRKRDENLAPASRRLRL